MSRVQAEDREQFFRDVEEASKKAIWCALATVGPDGPRVRIVHPTWEGETLWFATSSSSPKVAQLRREPRVDIQFQVSPPDFVHVMVRGSAEVIEDAAERRRVWDVLDYDLSEFWPGGPEDETYVPIRVLPERVELSRMFGSMDKRVWRS